eukprot:2605413-Pyramimonas_sp.AAC.1
MEDIPGRLLFAHIHWGAPGGFTPGSACLGATDGMTPASTAYWWAAVQALAKLNGEGHDWLVGGHWNNEPAALFTMGWATAASA